MAKPAPRPDAIWQGGWTALVAAVVFGVTTPFVQRFGRGTGPFLTAGLLYLGAAIGCARRRSINTPKETSIPRDGWRRVLTVAVLGAVLAPACLAWGLQRTGAMGASLLLNLEAVFTVMLSALLHREPIGRRVTLAMTLMVLAGGALVAGGQDPSPSAVVGMVGILLATVGWALDNVLTKPLADFDPTQVVRWKALLGAGLSLATAGALGESVGSRWGALGLMICGLTGYGFSLKLYLRAQRLIGSGRTGGIFAVAPFIGAVAAWGLGDRTGGWHTVVAALLFAMGIYLHLTERHAHTHIHDELEHEHFHRHDDGHHDHEHDPPVDHEHCHVHRHARVAHTHAHAFDTHHRHRH